jgi:hypothetical protein
MYEKDFTDPSASRRLALTMSCLIKDSDSSNEIAPFTLRGTPVDLIQSFPEPIGRTDR